MDAYTIAVKRYWSTALLHESLSQSALAVYNVVAICDGRL